MERQLERERERERERQTTQCAIIITTSKYFPTALLFYTVFKTTALDSRGRTHSKHLLLLPRENASRSAHTIKYKSQFYFSEKCFSSHKNFNPNQSLQNGLRCLFKTLLQSPMWRFFQQLPAGPQRLGKLCTHLNGHSRATEAR